MQRCLCLSCLYRSEQLPPIVLRELMQYVWHRSQNKHRAPLHPLLLSLTPETLFILFICWPGCLVLVSLFVVCCFLGKKKRKSEQWGIKCGDSQISSLLMVVFCPIELPISSHPDSRRSRRKQKRSQKTETGEEKKVNSVKSSLKEQLSATRLSRKVYGSLQIS